MSDIAKDKASTSNAPYKRRAKPVESFIEFGSALGELAVTWLGTRPSLASLVQSDLFRHRACYKY
jgi:hypothetical protein